MFTFLIVLYSLFATGMSIRLVADLKESTPRMTSFLAYCLFIIFCVGAPVIIGMHVADKIVEEKNPDFYE